MEQEEEIIPEPTSIKDMPPVREQIRSRFVKKTLSLPAWLSATVESDGVNCSKLFQNVLMDYLGSQK